MKRRQLLKGLGAGALVGGALSLQAPAVHARKKYRWKMVTTWPKNFPGLGTAANTLAKNIEKMSDKRIKVKVFGAGELVSALEVFDAVVNGTAELGHGAAYYWKGKHPAAQFFASVPFGLNPQEMSGWLAHGGGQALWDELYAGFGLKPFPVGNTGMQMGGWFNREIKTVDDFKGLKIRMPGLGADVLKKLGATPVVLPGGEIFQALQTGTIDAAEWVGPYNDLAFGFHKIAKYYYWPGWHEPGAVLECMVNQQAFAKLPEDLKNIVKVAMQASYHDMVAEFTARNSIALKSLVGEHQVTLKSFSEDTLKKLNQVSEEVVYSLAQTDQYSKKVYQSFLDFRSDAIPWMKIGEQGYSLARSMTSGGK